MVKRTHLDLQAEHPLLDLGCEGDIGYMFLANQAATQIFRGQLPGFHLTLSVEILREVFVMPSETQDGGTSSAKQDFTHVHMSESMICSGYG
jgi:hypothetical protein